MKAFNPADEVGNTAPLNYFDPLGFSQDEESFRRYRTAEIKHGRVAMMASIGALAQTAIRFPGFENYKGTFKALEQMLEPNDPNQGALAAFVVSCGFLELVLWQENPNKAPGDFGDPAGLSNNPDWGYTENFRNRELNNGRFAMFVVAGIYAAEVTTGYDAWQQIARLYCAGRGC